MSDKYKTVDRRAGKVGQDRYEHPSEDDMARARLGPRGVRGGRDPAKMTPQREKKTPKRVVPGHTA